jgi:signal transduction histidine kinase
MLNLIRQLFINITRPHYTFSNEEWILRYKIYIMLGLSFVLGSILFLFGVYRLMQEHFLLAFVDIGFSFHLFGSGFWLKYDKSKYDIVSKAFLILGMAVGFLALHLGEGTFTRYMWFASFILFVFFLRDKEEGYLWLTFMIIVFSIIAYFVDHLQLDMVNYVTFIVNLLLIGMILYWYEKLKEGDTERLNVLNDELKQEIQSAMEVKQKQERMMIEQSKMAAMGEMMQSIAHQWRQPLNILGLSMAKVEMENELGVSQQEKLKSVYAEMNRQIEYMSHTIDDFRNFYQQDKVKVNVDVGRLFDDVSALIEPMFRSKGIVLSVDAETSLACKVYVNEMKQVILNLVTNAKDAIVERHIDKGHIRINAYREGDQVIISVHDNGGGIDETIIHKIYEPYFTTKFASKGTGIGLYMSKLIIEEHMNGEIRVTNENDGACFTLSLPVTREES